MNTLEVRWHGAPNAPMVLGRLSAQRDGIYFEFSAAASAAKLDPSPIRLSTDMRLHRAPREPFNGLHGLFNDSLPDGFGALLMDRWIQRQGADPRAVTPLERLAIVGSHGMGALSYYPETGPAPTEISWDLAAAEREIQRVTEGETSALLHELVLSGGSPQGARPKLLVALSADGKAAFSGSQEVPPGFTPALVKFPVSPKTDAETRLEEAYARMARAAGLYLPATRLMEMKGGRAIFAVDRFDRAGNQRVHMHSVSGLLEADHRVPNLDYEALLRLTRRLTGSQQETEAMFRLAVFNVLAHNRDDHSKNFAYLQSAAGTWRLSPAFDLTYSAGPGGEHTTTILGEGRSIPRSLMKQLGSGADIDDDTIDLIIDSVEAAVAQFSRFAAEVDVPKREITAISKNLGFGR